MLTLNKFVNKKGQSLVEVVVALSILTIVLTSTITLILNTVDLALSARNRTEAVTLAQKAITDGTVRIDGGCNIVADLSTTFSDYPEPNGKLIRGGKTAGGKNVRLFMKATTDSTFGVTDNGTENFDPTKFVMLVAEVTWKEKGASTDSIYLIKEVVKR